jgi:5'-3' exonuclease
MVCVPLDSGDAYMGVTGWNNLIPWIWAKANEVAPGNIAIDMPNYLTRRVSVITPSRRDRCRIPLHHAGITLSLVRVCMRRSVLPVLVYDGPPERTKRFPNPELILTAQSLYRQFKETRDPFDEEIANSIRKSPSLRMYFAIEHTRELARVLGIPAFSAPSEAEMFSAALCRDGLVNTVVTNDSDALLFGSPHVTKQLQLSKGLIQRATLADLKRATGLDIERLRDLAMICGCDFHKQGVKGVGPRKGIILLQRYGGLESLLKARGYSPIERREFMDGREAFDEASYISTQGIILDLNPPLVSKLMKLLTIFMVEERAEEIKLQFVKLWKQFGTRQETLEQWL